MKEYVEDIITWYDQNKRDLPWRKNKNPYFIWISEIMLQQTRIEAVIDYFYRFVEAIPTVEDLSCISEEKLLKLWEGLGYYHRVRNLQKAAKIIVSKYHGVFPNEYDQLIELPGVGDYTASAIASICFQEKKATIDGNVLRVYTRFYNDLSDIHLSQTKNKIKQEMEEILPLRSGDFNQALMEIGEVLCIPKGTPLCDLCPLHERCLANQNKNYFLFPQNSKKTDKKTLTYTVFIFEYDGKYAIKKRKENSLLNGLWEFPNVEGNLTKSQVEQYLKRNHISSQKIIQFISHQHIFTHQQWKMSSYFVLLDHIIDDDDLFFLDADVLKTQYAIPTAFQPFLTEIFRLRKG